MESRWNRGGRNRSPQKRIKIESVWEKKASWGIFSCWSALLNQLGERATIACHIWKIQKGGKSFLGLTILNFNDWVYTSMGKAFIRSTWYQISCLVLNIVFWQMNLLDRMQVVLVIYNCRTVASYENMGLTCQNFQSMFPALSTHTRSVHV